jgi:hypothetical protein
MKILIGCLLVVMLSGCIPIGIQANTRAINPVDRSAAPDSAGAGSLALY